MKENKRFVPAYKCVMCGKFFIMDYWSSDDDKRAADYIGIGQNDYRCEVVSASFNEREPVFSLNSKNAVAEGERAHICEDGSLGIGKLAGMKCVAKREPTT